MAMLLLLLIASREGARAERSEDAGFSFSPTHLPPFWPFSIGILVSSFSKSHLVLSLSELMLQGKTHARYFRGSSHSFRQRPTLG